MSDPSGTLQIAFTKNTESTSALTTGYVLDIVTRSLHNVQVPDEMLVIRRTSIDPPVDTFVGVVRPVDFTALGKESPLTGAFHYRTKSWRFIFANQTTMEETIDLLKKQITVLADTLGFNNSHPMSETALHVATYSL